MEENIDKQVIEKTEQAIKKQIDEGLTTNNLDIVYKLAKIKHMAKEDSNMNYGEYGRRAGYDAYGRENYGNYNDYGNYNRRGYDAKYRGHSHLDRMYGEYGRYEAGREEYNRGNYGAKDDTLKSLEYMLESAVNFFEMLKNDANSQEEINLIRKYSQKIAQM